MRTRAWKYVAPWCVVLAGCAGGIKELASPAEVASWQTVQSDAEIAAIRQLFPEYQPDRVRPGTDPTNKVSLKPDTFFPAQFFGRPSPQGMKSTPGGIRYESNGYEAPRMPVLLASPVTYFTPDHQTYSFPLVSGLQISALRKIEERLGMAISPDPSPIVLNRTEWRVDPAEIDRIFREVQTALARRLPAVANVDVRNCEVIIEPSIFYVSGSNFGNTWASGLTDAGSPTRLHLAVYYINANKVQVDWRLVLIDEAINFFVISIGRFDLAL